MLTETKDNKTKVQIVPGVTVEGHNIEEILDIDTHDGEIQELHKSELTEMNKLRKRQPVFSKNIPDKKGKKQKVVEHTELVTFRENLISQFKANPPKVKTNSLEYWVIKHLMEKSDVRFITAKTLAISLKKTGYKGGGNSLIGSVSSKMTHIRNCLGKLNPDDSFVIIESQQSGKKFEYKPTARLKELSPLSWCKVLKLMTKEIKRIEHEFTPGQQIPDVNISNDKQITGDITMSKEELLAHNKQQEILKLIIPIMPSGSSVVISENQIVLHFN
jgi:hypothetical protein